MINTFLKNFCCPAFFWFNNFSFLLVIVIAIIQVMTKSGFNTLLSSPHNYLFVPLHAFEFPILVVIRFLFQNFYAFHSSRKCFFKLKYRIGPKKSNRVKKNCASLAKIGQMTIQNKISKKKTSDTGTYFTPSPINASVVATCNKQKCQNSKKKLLLRIIM